VLFGQAGQSVQKPLDFPHFLSS